MSNPPNTINLLEEEQRQYELYLQNAPTVSYQSYQYLILEAVPACISLEFEKHSVEDSEDTASSANLHFYKNHQMLYKYTTLSQQQQENVLHRIYSIGFDMGTKLSNLLIFTKNPNFHFQNSNTGESASSNSSTGTLAQKKVNADLLSIMKFICRDVWRLIFNKQIDNLKTNHKGTFYLMDKSFSLFQNFSIESSSKDCSADLDNSLLLVKPYLQLCLGIIKGVLNSLQINNVTDKEDIICSYDFPKDMPLGSVSFNIFVPMK